MPYIKPEARTQYESAIKALVLLIRHAPPGEINYCITRICAAWLDSVKPVGYTELAMLIGILETCKLEMQHRLLEPFEGKKLKENGDAFTPFPQEIL